MAWTFEVETVDADGGTWSYVCCGGRVGVCKKSAEAGAAFMAHVRDVHGEPRTGWVVRGNECYKVKVNGP